MSCCHKSMKVIDEVTLISVTSQRTGFTKQLVFSEVQASKIIKRPTVTTLVISLAC